MENERQNIEIKLLNKDSIDQQVILYKSAFNHLKDFEVIREEWVLKHYHNPIQNSFIFGAYIDEKLVGMNAYLPTMFNLSGNEVLCIQSCESAVDPNFQGRGIWSKVVRYALDYIFNQTNYQFVFGFPNYRNSYPGFVKMGWKTLLNMNNYILINNGKSFSNTYDGKFRAFRGVLRLGGIQKTIVKCKGKNAPYQISQCTVEELLWNDDDIGFKYSKEYIRWRCECKSAMAFNVKDPVGNSIASCIYDTAKFNGTDITKIERVEINSIDPKTVKQVWACILNYLIKSNTDHSLIRLWLDPTSPYNQTLSKLGLIKSSHPNPFIIYPKPTFNQLDNISNWDLSFFDLDY